MNGRRVRAVATRVIEQFRHDRRSLGLMFVVPLVILSLIGYLWNPSGDARRPPIGVVSEDRGPLGVVLAQALLSSRSVDASLVVRQTPEDALRDGRFNAIVRIPENFSEELARSRRAMLAVRLEGSDPFVTGGTLAALQRAASDAAAGAAPVGGGGVSLDVTYLYGGADYKTLDYLGPVLIPFLAFFFVFLLTDVAFLRERASGTLERVLATPLRRGELVAGYILGLSFFALVQSLVVVLFSIWVLGVRYRGNIGTIFLVEAAMVLVAVNLGLLVSAFARNEFQAVQFMPIVLLPQVLLSGIFIPIADLPGALQPLAWVLPLTYTNEALRAVMIKGASLTDAIVLRDIGVLLAFAALVAAGATATIRREVA